MKQLYHFLIVLDIGDIVESRFGRSNSVEEVAQIIRMHVRNALHHKVHPGRFKQRFINNDTSHNILTKTTYNRNKNANSVPTYFTRMDEEIFGSHCSLFMGRR